MEQTFKLKSSEKRKKSPKDAPERSPGPKTLREKYYLCATCFNRITTDRFTIEIMGSSFHNFTNPAGIKFDIICFSDAGGCNVAGIPSMEFTWFPGHPWCYAYCSSCKTHLGWFYKSAKDTFFGLIKKKLRFDSLPH